MEQRYAGKLKGKVAAVTGAASGIGQATAKAMLAAGARVVLVDRGEVRREADFGKHGDAAIPLVVNLLDPKSCSSMVPQILEKAGQLDILHCNAGSDIGGDLVDANTAAIDRMLNLNVNVSDEKVRERIVSINHHFDGRRSRLTGVGTRGRRSLRLANLRRVASRRPNPPRRRVRRRASHAPPPTRSAATTAAPLTSQPKGVIAGSFG